jgi:hypothetical protein
MSESNGAICVTGRDGHGHELPVTEHGPGNFSGESDRGESRAHARCCRRAIQTGQKPVRFTLS